MSDNPATEGADPSARHRLPYSVEPRRYALRLTPDLDNATFTGEVHIEVLVHETVDEIVLHAAELTIESAELVAAVGRICTCRYTSTRTTSA